ncbi:SMI1/KNR4 family protein [Listeria weihenstephanensis]|uniref:SMI1/KNR4 family protein n=1 Tax=Listeria weihenstephanensis TaxID=1006155 RepID=A0A841Z651_9LIST|nr:SMI1/KNR4 family protein [Listeria weihenstephanensis]MBC1500740.1 SMI1/KNR4 family protein [Listeria weihenstephanensis]
MMERYVEMSATQKNGVELVELERLERILGVSFGAQYRELVRLVNAPEFGEWLFYPVKDSRNLQKTFDDVARNTKLARENGLAAEFVAIAEDGTGDLMCLRIGDAGQLLEEVFVWLHERRECELMYRNLVEMIENQ